MVRVERMGVLLAGLALAVLAGCTGSGSDKAGGKRAPKPVVLTLAFTGNGSLDLDGFVTEVRRLSAGKIRIDVKSGWQSDQVKFENELIGDVRTGKVNLGVVGSRAWDSVGVISLRALTAPLLIDSYALQDRVVRSPISAQMLTGLRPLGLVGIGVLPGPLRKPLGVTRPLLRPADYARSRIGVQQSRVADATMRTLGATPVWFGAQASIAGFDGIEQQISSIEGNRYFRVGKYLTANVNLWPRPLVLFANRKTFTALTPAQRRILRRAVVDSVATETKAVADEERDVTAAFCRSGRPRLLAASPAVLSTLRQAVQPVYDQLERDLQTRRYISQIEAMRDEVTPEPAPSCAPLAAPIARKAGALDGVYQFTVTPGDLRDVGTPPGDIGPTNYGRITIVVDRGRFAQTQETKEACTWGYGTLTVRGDRFVQLFTDGGGISPDNALNKPGERISFGWSLYRDTVKLRPVKGAISPPPSMAKPWHRISTKPSRRYFSKRCPPPAKALPD
jgi:TRAP-type transport system periplasmic protein